MNEDLFLSPEGANLIKAFEACLRKLPNGKFAPYRCPAGVWTIGWGHTNAHGRKFTPRSVWTQEECDQAFEDDMQGFETAVKRRVRVDLDQHQFDALVSFAYNCGEGNLAKSTLLKKVNRRDFDGAAREFAKWNKGGGKVLRGLVRRRASEALLFQGIPDADYDGRPDKPQRVRTAEELPEDDYRSKGFMSPSAVHEDELMPQGVDAPEPPKNIAESNTAQAAVVGGGTSIMLIIGQTWEQVRDIVSDPTVLLIGTLVVAATTGFVLWDRNRKLKEEQV